MDNCEFTPLQGPTCSKYLLASLLTLVSIGCGSADPLLSPTGQRLEGLATAYLDYAVAKGVGPANETELRQHMCSMPCFALGLAEVNPEAIDAMLISARDGQPFVIRYGASISLSSEGASLPIAFEKVGKESTRLVAFADGHVECTKEINFNNSILGFTIGF